jgi:serine/threonine-protein kinase PpkA
MSINIPGYRIIRKINSGGMSTVYLAIQISVGRIVALKVMSPGLTSDPAFNERFQREATIVGQLSHPNIVSIYDIGREDDLNYIAMDYLPGGSLHDKMINGLTGAEVVRVTKDIANALDHAHEKGYIHRDIKPENILFRSDNSAVLSDFGVAKVMIGVSRMTHVGTVVGTPQYMSPEQARGQTVDARSDLYSLGVVFYEMLTGSLPFPGDDAVTIALKHISAPIPRLPLQYQAYQKILDKFLAKDSMQRFQRGREITEAFDHFDAILRATYNTSTSTPHLSVFALFRALCSAAIHSIYWRWKKIQRTLFGKDSEDYSLSSVSNNRVPVKLTTRVQAGVVIDEPPPRKKNRIIFFSRVSIFSLLVWLGGSLAMHYHFQKNINSLPKFLQSAIRSTIAFLPFVSDEKEKTITAENLNINASSESLSSTNPSTMETQQLSSKSTQPAEVISSGTTRAQNTSAISVEMKMEAPEKTASTYALTINVTPKKSRVKLLNTSSKYSDGITLAPGRYQVELSKPGYVTKTEWVEIKNQAIEFNYQLVEEPIEKSQPVKNVTLPLSETAKTNSSFIRVAAGSFIMGDDNNPLSVPARKVVIPKAFLIGKYEITFDEYDLFVKATDRPQPGDNGWGRETHPVINVSWSDAQAYVQWLSKNTGKKYRLPTEAEWEYVAKGGSKTRFWWGDDELDAKGKANCRRGCYSNYSGLFGSKTAPVGSYPANGFGIHDMAGNVAEWVQDCYKDQIDNSPSTGTAQESQECQTRSVRGGSTKNNAQDLASASRDHFPADNYSEVIGFRVVMELP